MVSERTRASKAAWRKANRDKTKEYNRRYRKVHSDRITFARQRRRAEHPEKAKARDDVSNAIREGRLFKPDRCECCRQQFPPKGLHGHHKDYSKALEVEWLCPSCHTKRHMSVEPDE